MADSPHAIALISSPLQLLNAWEWAYAQGRVMEPWLLGDYLDPASRLQTERMLADLGLPLRELDGYPREGWRGLGTMRDYFRRCRDFALKVDEQAGGRIISDVLIGDPRLRPSGYVCSRLQSAGQRVWILDDGSASKGIAEVRAKGKGGPFEVKGGWAEWMRGRFGGLVHWYPKRLHFYSIYELNPAAGDIVESNRQTYLKSLPVISGGEVWFIGSCNVETGLATEDRYLDAVRRAFVHEGFHVYMAHRREAEAKLGKIRDLGVTVRRPEVPLEYLCARSGRIPARIIGIATTVFDTFHQLWGGRIEYVRVDPGRDYATAGQAEHYARIVGENAKVGGRVWTMDDENSRSQ